MRNTAGSEFLELFHRYVIGNVWVEPYLTFHPKHLRSQVRMIKEDLKYRSKDYSRRRKTASCERKKKWAF